MIYVPSVEVKDKMASIGVGLGPEPTNPYYSNMGKHRCWEFGRITL